MFCSLVELKKTLKQIQVIFIQISLLVEVWVYGGTLQ